MQKLKSKVNTGTEGELGGTPFAYFLKMGI